MKTLSVFSIASCVMALGLCAVAAAADVKKDRADIQKTCQDTLAVLYKEKPELKGQIAKSAGYGCFSSFGVTVLVGGAGGKGLVHDNATNKVTYMNMAQASAGIEVGVKDYREVLVFKDRNALTKFVESGWDATAGGGASAEVKGKGGETTQSESAKAGIDVYPITKTGVGAGVSLAGRKYWKDQDLN
jgi:lipid-binding SYLF domain-containing protein